MKSKELDIAWRECVRIMYGGRCARCTWFGHAEESHADDTHHILTRGSFPQYKHHPANGLPLCRPCHDYAGLFTRYFLCELAEHAPDVFGVIEGFRRDRNYKSSNETDAALIAQYMDIYQKQYRLTGSSGPLPSGLVAHSG